jgi:putative DNA primase/helicase
LNDFTLHELGDKRWVGLPGKPQLDHEGRQRKDPATGKGLYEVPSRAVRGRFQTGAPSPPSIGCSAVEGIMNMNKNVVDRALSYAQGRGWLVFPTKLERRADGRVNKIPAVRDWPNTCSRDPDVIRRWWRQWPDAVISLVTGPRNGLVVLDVDIGVDKQDREFNGFDTLEEVFGWWASPETPTAHSPRGGVHFYFNCERAPDREILDKHNPRHRTAIGTRAGNLGAHIDVRGWNGQVVLPSESSGYFWDPHWNFDTVAPMPAPAWFNHRPPKPARSPSSNKPGRFDPANVLAESCRLIRHAPEGSRHDTYRHETFRIARLVGLDLLDERRARHDLESEVMALGRIADGHIHRVEQYFRDAWREGLTAARSSRRTGR